MIEQSLASRTGAHDRSSAGRARFGGPSHDSIRDVDGMSTTRRDWTLFLVVGLVAVGSWPAWTLTPATGVDGGWPTGLQLAQVNGMKWGQEVLFTYGPLGFIDVPQVWSVVSLVGGLLYGLAAVLMITAVPCWLLSRQTSGVIAVGFSAAMALFAPMSLFLPEILSLGAFLLALGLFQGSVHMRPTLLAGVLGALAGIQALVKPPTAFVALLACLLAVVAPIPGLGKRASAGSVGLVAAVMGGWLLAGQSLADLPHWIAGVSDLARHYTEAMFVTPVEKFYELLAALTLAAGLVAYTIRYAVRMSRRNAFILVGTSAVALWLTAKEAFVRHDMHSAIFFFAVAALAVAVRTTRPAPVRQLSVLVVSGLVLATVAAGSTVAAAVDPGPSVRSFFSLVSYIGAPGHRAEAAALAAGQLRAAYNLPDPIREAVSTGTVHVDPWETTIVWAFGLQWRPVPVFQRYQAYTRRSDMDNAQWLERRNAPDRVLRHETVGLDGRNDLWDSPRYMLNLVCLYRQALSIPPWQLLERAPSRCGPVRFRANVRFSAGETIAVPRGSDHELVLVWLDLDESIGERLRTLLFRPSAPILVNTGGAEFRVATSQVAGPLLFRLPAGVGWDTRFGGGVDYQSLRVNRSGTARFAMVTFS